MKSSRHSGSSVDCPRSASSMKRLINSLPRIIERIIAAQWRFHTARVKSCPDAAETRLLVCPEQRTSSDRPACLKGANFCLKRARQTWQRVLRQMLLVHAWAGLTLRRRARKSLTQRNTMDLDRSEDLDWSMEGADPWDFC